MAQKTNLNVSPYYDDFSEPDVGARDKNYYKVLFNPGKPVQARELNTLQSILQDQVETFGSHIFKEGSMVIPGNIVYDNQFNAVKLSLTTFGVNIAGYINNFIGKKITGQVSGTTATVQFVQLPNTDVEYVTIYVKYIDSDNNFSFNQFQDGESLSASENVSYGGTLITAGTPFASTISANSTSTGSAASIGDGVYFIRGTFVRVPQQTIILDYYTNTPSYRVGLKIDEQIITAKDDSTLYDNAKGFTNYAAPGADRFKISLTLTKRLLTDIENDTDFVEILRVKDGAIKKIESKSQYSIIRDYLAQRTYDESGDYVVDPFEFSLNNSLNNRLGNDGIFFSDEKTEKGNTPSDDLMCIKFTPGKAYVRGYDIEKTGIEIVDVPKPRTKQSVSNVGIPFEMGNLVRLNNVSGAPKLKSAIELYNLRKSSNSISTGTKIGDARIYELNPTDAAYSSAVTNWDLYLYDIQTYTQLTLNQSLSSLELPATSFVKGKNSGASGYVTSAGAGSVVISLRQTSGIFSVGEQITINGVDLYPRSIRSIKVYSAQDIKSVFQSTAVSGFSTSFVADTQLDKSTAFGFTPTDKITIQTSGAVSAPTKTFSGIASDTIIRYQRVGFLTETYNRVASVSADGTSMTLVGVSTVTGICDGGLPGSQTETPFTVGIPKIRDEQSGYLYAKLPDSNIASTNLSNSYLTFTAQSNTSLTPSSNTLTVNTGNFNLGISSISATFQPFDEERYSIHYFDGSIENLTPDKVTLSNNSSQVTFSNISNKSIAALNATFIKNGVQSKLKKYNRSQTLNIGLSKYPQSGTGISTSINDGLTYNQFYGLRVQDEEICLNYPDVVKIIAIYESLDTNTPVLDKLTFNSISNVSTNAIIGENIIGSASKAIARIVSKPSTNDLNIVYLNTSRFVAGENVSFEESNINTSIESITPGVYKDLTNKFTLDKGQKDQYYDYSKIIRNFGESAPTKKLLVVFDHYTVPTGDTGDLFTVNSYEQERFSEDIPSIGQSGVRASDTLDFRPRVSQFTSTTSSPFDFSSRSFNSDPKVILSPGESSIIGYDFYLGRIDKLYLDKLGNFIVLQGTASTNPKVPNKPDNVMELATITLPPYLYNPKDASISVIDNRRYTMRDIGLIEDRVENLERVTSLSLLELNTQTLQIQDAQGFNRFKSGFFVDDFKNYNLINTNFSTIEVDVENDELTTKISKNSINLKPVPAQQVTDENLDLSTNFALLDSNVQKTGDVITLKYNSIGWIEQPLATKSENVNPFHVVSYNGTVKLNPESDSWVRTIRLQDVNINSTNWVWLYATGTYKIVGSSTKKDIQDNLISSGTELYMRSRNTGFSAVNLKPLTKIYQFLDGSSGVDFIPKLIEISTDSTLSNYGASSAFSVGETVVGTFGGKNLIKFRVATANHKDGGFNNPTVTYNINPYVKSENLPSSYSASSKVLNVDINGLCDGAQGLYSGYLVRGMRLVGQTSGAVAYVKDLRLISDNYGDLQGAFFLRDPNTSPAPPVRIATGSKTYKLTSSSTNEIPLPGSRLISSAETTYKAEGTWEERQRVTTTTTTIYYVDPLAQSFSVGGNVEDLNGNSPNDDSNGAYLTAVDLFFASKDSDNAPVTVEVRTVELGTPTRTVLGKPVTLKPSQVNVSTNATVATTATFEYPIYLAPSQEYAIVLLAPQSDQYQVWIAEMGEKTVNTSTLPDAESVRYTRQFALGSLFKSQNGTIWTANQYQDMKFKLYKAEFTSTTGSAYFNNPTLNESNGYVPTLLSNPVTALPRKVNLGITTTTNSTLIGILTTGRKISDSVKTYNYGYIVGTGSSVSTVGITTGGSNYTATSNVSTYAITGNGSGLRVNITGVSGVTSSITSVTVATPGNGYSVGDVVGIVTSTVSPAAGRDARITISAITGLDTLYLSNVQGESFTTTAGISTIVYYNDSGVAVSVAGTSFRTSTSVGGFYNGNFLKVNHFDHGMYATTNKLSLTNIQSDLPPTTLSIPLSSIDTTISVASTSIFSTFEGVSVSASNPGYIKIDNEIIKYESLGTGQLATITRGIDSTIVEGHNINAPIYKYEFSGVSLRRINKTHDISDTGIEIDSYYVEIDRTNFDSNAISRELDASLSSAPQLSFNSEFTGGGENAQATENIQYNAINPQILSISPGSNTKISAQIKSVSGTSVNGTESSFNENVYEDVEIGKVNRLSSTRIICSNVNEQTYLSGNKSFTTKVNLSTTDSNLSPMIFWKNSSVTLLNNRLNYPISNYIEDNRVNSLIDDPHASVYVSNTVRLAQPATSLKVIVSAYRHSSADFRVLYSLIRPDSSEIAQAFELFPGYNNLTVDYNQDGYPDIIDPSKNSGLPDVFVPASLDNQFLDYEFNVSNLGQFTGYTIKIVMAGTNQAYAPRFKDLRSIAVR